MFYKIKFENGNRGQKELIKYYFGFLRYKNTAESHTFQTAVSAAFYIVLCQI